ncbi:hypothetical protein T06_3004 [Trichinella sp. T6]|nr:hypothetical protein T06_3004 [Trichinella sp. T6]
MYCFRCNQWISNLHNNTEHKIGNFTIIKNLYTVTIYIQALALMQGTSSGERGGYKDTNEYCR